MNAAVPGKSAGLVVAALVVLAAGGIGVPGRASAGGLSCVAVSTWTDRALAAETVAVPAEESAVSGAAPEVSAGAGAVVLFGTAGPTHLGADLAALSRRVPGRLGVLVMTDEEGGGVQRMANLVGSLPWARFMGQHWSAAQITGRVAAVARRMVGYRVDVDLAPVLDVDGRNVPPGPTDPDGWRSFGGRTALVIRDGLAYLRGLAAGGVVSVVKHFPGLGGASGNTDDGPAHTLPWSRLQQVAIPPFARAIAAGVPGVMVANATVPGLSELPASLSRAVVARELVGALRFSGLVVTDSLSARAISGAGYSVPAAAVRAVWAGADLVLYGPVSGAGETDQMFRAVVGAEVAAVGDGRLTRARLVAAASAVLAARHRTVCP